MVILPNKDTNAQSTPDKEDTDAPVDGLEGAPYIYTGVLGFGCNRGDVFRPDDGEDCSS